MKATDHPYMQWIEQQMREARECSCLHIFIACAKKFAEIYESGRQEIDGSGSGSSVDQTGNTYIKTDK